MSVLFLRLKKTTDNSYNIVIHPGVFENIAQYLKEQKLGKRCCIITDSKVKKLYGEKLLKNLRKFNLHAGIISFPAGEKSKTLEMAEKISAKMAELGINKHDLIIALGGGTVGDLAGFIASIYMRGIAFIQIPTTLLAMVDSAIGGKNGVDTKFAKNMLGTFYQPKKVYIDSLLLESLPIKEIRNGLAESIKYAIIKSSSLFRFLEKNTEKILKFDHKKLNFLIKKSVKIKKRIIEKDEKENNLRMILNYGHTYGHALEQASDYQLSHGEAIAIGMSLINKIAVEKGILKEKHALRIINLFNKTELPQEKPKNITLKKIHDLIKFDKKMDGNKLNLVIPVKIGKAKIMQI